MPDISINAFAIKHGERGDKIREYARKQGFPAYKEGGRWKVNEEEGIEWLLKYRSGSTKRLPKAKREELEDGSTIFGRLDVDTLFQYNTSDSVGPYEVFARVVQLVYNEDDPERVMEYVVQPFTRQERQTVTRQKLIDSLSSGTMRILAPDEVRARLYKLFLQPAIWATVDALVPNAAREEVIGLCKRLRHHLQRWGDIRVGHATYIAAPPEETEHAERTH